MDLSNNQIKTLLKLDSSVVSQSIDKYDNEDVKVLQKYGLVEVLSDNAIGLTAKGRGILEEA